MGERIFARGNEAVGWGAVNADCFAFFGYPITPQNEVTEWFAREMPKRGRIFLQSQSEVGSINMLYGAAAAGVRAMTSTSSPGWALMQETMSHLAAAELPCVVVLVTRGGPGSGSVRHSQMDYMSATRGGGQGGYKNIVLAPWSAQETHDLVQMAFYLADKYCNPAIVLTDGILGQMREPMESKVLDFGPLPQKEWALRGKDSRKGGKRSFFHSGPGVLPMAAYPSYVAFLEHLEEKYHQIMAEELRYESYEVEDAEVVMVAFGYVARVCREVVNIGRGEGLKLGLMRLITPWPFPYRAIWDKALGGCKFLVVEDNLGHMVEDVQLAVQGRASVHLVGIKSRHMPTDGGMIMPDSVFKAAKGLV